MRSNFCKFYKLQLVIIQLRKGLHTKVIRGFTKFGTFGTSYWVSDNKDHVPFLGTQDLKVE